MMTAMETVQWRISVGIKFVEATRLSNGWSHLWTGLARSHPHLPCQVAYHSDPSKIKIQQMEVSSPC